MIEIDWDDYRYVLAIADANGLSGAGRQLGVTHATVARRLDRVERALGHALFERLNTGLRPTAAGLRVVDHARAMEASAHALDLAATADGAESGPLALTLPPLLLTDELAKALANFAAKHPALSLSILTDRRLSDLHRREADVAIRVETEPQPGLWGRKVADQTGGYFCAPGKVDAFAREGASLIGFAHWRRAPEDLPADRYRLGVVVDDMDAALSLARAGAGMVRAPHALALAAGLVAVPGLPIAAHKPIWVLTHPALKDTSKVRSLMTALIDHYRAHKSDFVRI